VSDDPVDQINRFAISVIALLVIFVALIVVVLAWGASGAMIDRIDDFAGYLRDHDDRSGRVVVSLAALIVVLLMLTVMIVELTPSPLQRMRVRNVKAGDATITTPDIARRIEEEVRQVRHVADCAVVVAVRGQRIEVALDLHVQPGADLAHTADEACRRADMLVQEQMGLQLASRPRARLHYRELRLKENAVPQDMRRPSTGWERPASNEGIDDDRGNADAPEEAQA
jgi:hypothetical protein